MTQQSIQEIVRKQRSFFYKGNTLDIEFRIRSLKKLQASILEHQEQINAALKSDLGKSSFESYMCESGLVLSEITYMLKHIRSLSKEKTVHTPLAQFHSRSYQKPSPYGVVLVMSPWNYPFPVSYTHLDVYKRQVLFPPDGILLSEKNHPALYYDVWRSHYLQ